MKANKKINSFLKIEQSLYDLVYNSNILFLIANTFSYLYCSLRLLAGMFALGILLNSLVLKSFTNPGKQL